MTQYESDADSAGEFEDPLSDYAPRTYTDPLERALAEEPISAMRCRPFTAIAPDVPVQTALQTMVSSGITCVLVAEGSRLVGIFSERDVLNKVASAYGEIRDRPVSEVMTPDPFFLYESDVLASAFCVMAIHRFRHVPVLDENENIVGIVSPQRVTTFLQGAVEGAAGG